MYIYIGRIGLYTITIKYWAKAVFHYDFWLPKQMIFKINIFVIKNDVKNQ